MFAPTSGCLLAEIIPAEPDPDNAGEGIGLWFAFLLPALRSLEKQMHGK
jgi:hypothetical protein